MSSAAELVVKAALVGIGGTIVLDLGALFMARVMGRPATDWAMVGRWFGNMPRGRFVQETMTKASLLVLFLTVFIDLIGFGMVIPFLSYYAREYGASGVTVGAVVGVYSIMQFFCAPIWGRLSDRIGRRPVILASIFGLGLCATAMALARAWSAAP